MIYIFYGLNKEDMRHEARGFLDGLLDKNEQSKIERIYPEDLSSDKLNDFIFKPRSFWRTAGNCHGRNFGGR